VLAARADAEALEENQKDKEIVDAERGFNRVACHKLKCRLMAFGDGDPSGEGGCGRTSRAVRAMRRSVCVASRGGAESSQSATSSAATTA